MADDHIRMMCDVNGLDNKPTACTYHTENYLLENQRQARVWGFKLPVELILPLKDKN